MRRIVAILAVSAIALAACGGSSGSKSDSNGNSDSFSKLFEQSRNATLKVTYSSTDENGTTGGDAFTIAQDGPNKTAFITGDSEVIVNGTTATQCSNLQSEPSCTDYPGGVEAARAQIATATATLSAANAAITGAAKSNGVGKSSTSQIAGRTAECVTITPGGGIVGDLAKKLGGGSYESCLDKDTGVVLKWQVQGGNQAAGIIATKVEQPTAADFEAPAGSTETTVPGSSDTTTGDGSGEPTTTTCTPITLPGGGTLPGVPCVPA